MILNAAVNHRYDMSKRQSMSAVVHALLFLQVLPHGGGFVAIDVHLQSVILRALGAVATLGQTESLRLSELI